VGGIAALIRREHEKNSFGLDFPCECQDGGGNVMANSTVEFVHRLQAEIFGISWPLVAHQLPDTLDVLDLLQFCHRHIAQPEQTRYHDFFRHYHLEFDRAAAGQANLGNQGRTD
jgi:hypothetical protein